MGSERTIKPEEKKRAGEPRSHSRHAEAKSDGASAGLPLFLGGDRAAGPRVQAKRGDASAESPAEAPTIVHEVLHSPGEPLSQSVRSQFEPGFGQDLGKVRVHTGQRAAQSAEAVNAVAYTVGADVVFANGQYAPDTERGRRLLAHELTHVRQQGAFHAPGQSLPVATGEDSQEGAARSAEATIAPPVLSPISTPMVQRDKGDAKAVDIDKMDWKDAVDLAETNAKAPKTKSAAEDIYKKLVVKAAQNVTVSAPLVDRKPSVSDIIWNWTGTADYSAFVDPKKIDKDPGDYWKWITFKPSSIQKDQAFTVSVIFHEMDHAVHGKALYDLYQKASPKPKKGWADFYLDHFDLWTEAPIKLKDSGMASALSGLPSQIQPSQIEYRAYVNQFVNFFHKVTIDEQSYMARTVVLFYPLKKQSPKETISDPALNLASSRQQLLDYFKSPPVDKAKADTIRTRVAAEFKSALVLFRPDADQAQMKTDFKDIVDFPVDSDTKREARRAYSPEPL